MRFANAASITRSVAFRRTPAAMRARDAAHARATKPAANGAIRRRTARRAA
jgi:hypothetical protein